jgi:uncharacterized protein (DUF2267 family)
MSHVTALERALQTAYLWIDELDHELGWFDRQHGYVALRAALHALRDRLPVNEAADLAAQLPLVVRGIYFEGWRPAASPDRVRDLAGFLEPIDGALRFERESDAEEVARAVFQLLAHHLTAGEIGDVVATLPTPIAALFPAGAPAEVSDELW